MRYRNWAGLTVLLSLSLAFGCSEDSTSPEGGSGGTLTQADSVAGYWMQALSDSLQDLPQGGDADSYRNIRYTEIRDGFDAALAIKSNSTVAHLGSAIMDILELNYNTKLWSFVDSLTTYGDEEFGKGVGLYLRPGSPILRNQFTLLATAPREIMRRSAGGIPSNLSIGILQGLLETEVIPALSSSIDHLTLAEEGEGPNILVQVEDESHEIDLGEVYLFDAGVHAARAALHLLVGYDYELEGSDGSNQWIDEWAHFEDEQYQSYGEAEEIGPGQYRVTFHSTDRNAAEADLLLLSTLQYNLENRPGFLAKRGTHMEDAHRDLLALRDRLESGVAFIRNENDAQENDVVRIADLIDLDQDIATDSNKPNFAQNFTTIEDVLDWVETVLTSTYHLSEQGDNGLIEIDVNLSALFNNAPSNWREVLPYHQFTPQEGWLQSETNVNGPWPTGGTVCYTDIDGVYRCQDNVTEQMYVDDHWWLEEPIQYTDAEGTPVDLAVEEIPFFPDYTMRGLFPGATRSTWLDIANAW